MGSCVVATGHKSKRSHHNGILRNHYPRSDRDEKLNELLPVNSITSCKIIHRYKIAVMGQRGVGKSSLIIRYIIGDFFEDMDDYWEDYYRKLIEYRGEPAYLDILDFYDEVEFESMREEFMRQCKHFLLVYSITSMESFEKVKEIYDRILRSKKEYDDQLEMNIVLVATKYDLLSKYKYIDPIDKLKPEDLNILVYGYLQKYERKLGIGFIPEEIKKLCLLYIGKKLGC